MKIRILTLPHDRKFASGQVVDINATDAKNKVAAGEAELVGDDVEASYVEPDQDPEIEADPIVDPVIDPVVEPVVDPVIEPVSDTTVETPAEDKGKSK